MIAPNTRYVCKPVTALTPAEFDRWAEIQAQNAAYSSPFFHPRFSQIMGETKGNVEVTIIHHGAEMVGFFAFTRQGKTAMAPGLNFSGYEGIVIDPSAPLDLSALLKASGLKAWNFSKLSNSHAAFQPFLFGNGNSQLIDLTGGI